MSGSTRTSSVGFGSSTAVCGRSRLHVATCRNPTSSASRLLLLVWKNRSTTFDTDTKDHFFAFISHFAHLVLLSSDTGAAGAPLPVLPTTILVIIINASIFITVINAYLSFI